MHYNLLLDSGIPVEIRDRGGQTPLFYAVESIVLVAVQALSVARADVTVQASRK